MLLSVRRRWWPWLILSVPVSLVAAGSVGVAMTLLSTQSSPERRSSLQRRVARAAGGRDTGNTPREFALPPTEGVNDSPGVRLAFRLPMDGAEGWRVLGMAIACALWNALAAVFVFQLTGGVLSVGGRIGISALAIAPLAATGAWLTYSLLRDARTSGGIGVTRIEIDKHPLRPGDRCEAALIRPGDARRDRGRRGDRLVRFAIALVGLAMLGSPLEASASEFVVVLNAPIHARPSSSSPSVKTNHMGAIALELVSRSGRWLEVKTLPRVGDHCVGGSAELELRGYVRGPPRPRGPRRERDVEGARRNLGVDARRD